MKLWIARCVDGDLELHLKEPTVSLIAGKSVWVGDFIGCLYEDIVPEVTFENSPQEVELKLISN